MKTLYIDSSKHLDGSPTAPEVRIAGRDVPTVASLKRKIAAYKQLFGVEPIVEVFGNWYGPINGVESPEYSVHSVGRPLRIAALGSKYVTLRTGETNETDERVKLHDGDGNLDRGARTIILRPRLSIDD